MAILTSGGLRRKAQTQLTVRSTPLLLAATLPHHSGYKFLIISRSTLARLKSPTKSAISSYVPVNNTRFMKYPKSWKCVRGERWSNLLGVPLFIFLAARMSRENVTNSSRPWLARTRPVKNGIVVLVDRTPESFTRLEILITSFGCCGSKMSQTAQRRPNR